MAIAAGAIGLALFSVLAPIAWDPTPRLSALDETSTDVDIAADRPFELHPTHMGPAITSEALMRMEENTMRMPPIEVRATPESEGSSEGSEESEGPPQG